MSRGILSWGDFVLGGILSRGILSGGFCPGGFCPGGFCPDTDKEDPFSLLENVEEAALVVDSDDETDDLLDI